MLLFVHSVYYFSEFLIQIMRTSYVFYRACEMGRKEIVKALLEHNADGRIHPVTKYSPLYIACYNGRKDIVELLLKVRTV